MNVARTTPNGKASAKPVKRGIRYRKFASLLVRLPPESQQLKNPRRQGYAGATTSSVKDLSEVDLSDVPRFSSGAGEFDRVLGGGLVPGGVVLIGGHPGAGKSTLLLQTMCWLAQQQPAMYVTGEESLQQVAMRAQRLGLPTQNLKMLSETNVETIMDIAAQMKPKVMVIDSIQVMHLDGIESAPGSVSQVRESAAVLTRFAKQTQTTVLLVGHVTKDGALAGPKVLEHMVGLLGAAGRLGRLSFSYPTGYEKPFRCGERAWCLCHAGNRFKRGEESQLYFLKPLQAPGSRKFSDGGLGRHAPPTGGIASTSGRLCLCQSPSALPWALTTIASPCC